MERAIGMLVDTAAEQARHAARSAVEETTRLGGSVREHATDLAGEAARRAGTVAETLTPSSTPAAAVKATVRRRQRRRARRARRQERSGPPIALLAIVAIAAAIAIAAVMRKRRQSFGASPAPDAFGAAVDAERDAMAGNGQAPRPVTTPRP